VVVEVLALGVLRERRMRRVHDAALDRDLVDALRDLLGRRRRRAGAARLVEVVRLGDLRRRLGDQLVRALEVVVAVERLVDL
jgi:hypothetical protein